MIFYELDVPGSEEDSFFATLADTHKAGREFLANYGDISIMAVEVATDKAGVLELLNGRLSRTATRYWIFTKRGGIVETDSDYVPLKSKEQTMYVEVDLSDFSDDEIIDEVEARGLEDEFHKNELPDSNLAHADSRTTD